MPSLVAAGVVYESLSGCHRCAGRQGRGARRETREGAGHDVGRALWRRDRQLIFFGGSYGGELDIGFFPFVQADLSTFEGTKKVFDECMKRFATVDIVILNAGIGDGDKFFFDEKNPDNTAWKTMVDVNVNAVVYGTQLAMAEFREMNKPGTIVITASIGSFHAVKSLPVYVGTKSFVYNFARSVSKLLPKVRVHTVHPGAVNTPLARSSFTTIPGADELGKANEHELGILVPDDVADGMMYAIENDDLESGASIRVAWRGTDLVRTKVEQFRKIKDPRKLEAKAKI
ncbi:hypothetical protein DFJ74DRAFT_675139 [Hyaloraphidium curvatum]|nr:hypothetical protein DFJ74DRAFT_675139 [Hyaloraphidium curvatum]